MTARDRNVLVALVFLAVIGGFWFVGLKPRRTQAHSLDQQIAQAQSQRDTAVRSATRAQQARNSYAQDYATVVRLGKAVPADDDTASLIYQLQDAAGSARVAFQAFKLSGSSSSASAPATPSSATESAVAALPPGATVGPAGLSLLPLSLTFDGSYFTLEKFLRRLHGFTDVAGRTIRVDGRLLTLDGISLQAGPAGFPHIRAQVTASAFIAPKAKLPAPAPAGQATTSGSGAAVPAAPSTSAAILGVGR